MKKCQNMLKYMYTNSACLRSYKGK